MRPLTTALALLFLLTATTEAQTPDRDFRLEASILGYKGIGGTIDGIRNPVLQANRGETVRITIVNVEVLAHDIKMENNGTASGVINDIGEEVSITFVAEGNDIYFCTIPGHRTAGMEGRFQLIDETAAAIAGFPAVLDGRELNLGLESGSYEDWTATGTAFGDRPVEGDVLLTRTGSVRSQHKGTWWANSGELNGHRDKGTLTSDSFVINHPWASFLVAGGALGDLAVQLVSQESGAVLYEISGYDGESLRPVVVDLTDHQGAEIFVRLVDGEDGISGLPYIPDNKLAYIAFDDFQFYAERPTFPNELNPADIFTLPPILEVPNAGLSGPEAAAAMEVPDGFAVTLAAAEPDVVRPIAFTHDDRGRLWVVEAHTYPVPAPQGEGRDRVLVMEDTNGDGVLDSRKVAVENLNLVSGIEYGFGGLWVGAAPYLQFIPMEDDEPSGEPQIVLDGWGTDDTHETLNSLRWGPDGWLYGNHGVFTHSKVGKPGTPEAERVKLNGGIWRYHPTRGDFELFAEGTSNPWGLDFNENGHPFVTACVIPHLYHVIPGAHYTRQAYEHFNPYVYADIETHADHLHWVGDLGPHAGNHRSDEVGGGHAHAGAMFYLGGSWPEEYHDKLFMNNIHGFRANTDVIERSGSGYAGKHGDDFLFAHDSWSQMLNFRYGPDGSVHVIDWYDKNQCHSSNPDVHDKTLGRIFKIAHDNDEWVQVDLGASTDAELVEYLMHDNEWYVRTARRLLQERGLQGAQILRLKGILWSDEELKIRLRALWTLYSAGEMPDTDLIALTSDQEDVMRAWAVQLMADDEAVSDFGISRMAELAAGDASSMVRLYVAAALQRTPEAKRWETLEALYQHAEDGSDHNLPQMIWYAAEPLVPLDMDRALEMALGTEIRNLLRYTADRVAAVGTPSALSALARHLDQTESVEQQRVILEALRLLVGEAD